MLGETCVDAHVGEPCLDGLAAFFDTSHARHDTEVATVDEKTQQNQFRCTRRANG